MRNHLTTGGWLVAASLCGVAACGSPVQPTGGQPPPPATTSAAPFVVAAAASAVTSDNSVYVSLPPEAIPTGVTATIGDARTGSSVTANVVDGGFDPVALPASVGDTITIAVQTTGAPLSFVFALPASNPPIIVRTDPPPHKRDVPLNASMEVVFSEPIDLTTLTNASVQLLNGTTAIAGNLTFADSTHTAVQFIPTVPLTANTDYQLVVSGGVHDLHGDPLSTAMTVPFTTIASITVPATNEIAFNGIGTVNADGSGAKTLSVGTDAAWSPDGTKLAFVNAAGEISVMNSDGSNVTTLTHHTDPYDYSAPTWSHDGGRIAFGSAARGFSCIGTCTPAVISAIYVMNADGTGLTALVGGWMWAGLPSWSPDGTKIAFVGDSTCMCGKTWVMNADGSNPVQLPITNGIAGVPGGRLSWSPSGAQIAVAETWEDSEDREEVFVADADGSNAVQLTGIVDGVWNEHPSWSPDGSKIVFEKRVFSGAAIAGLYVMKADGSGVTLLLAGASAPAWSPKP